MVPGTGRSALAAAIGLVLTVTGCTGRGEDSAFPGLKERSVLPGITVGVILSDPAASARWEDVDRPLLTDALSAQGLQPDVENSEGDATMFAAIADSMISNGVKVLVIAAPNNQVGALVAAKARAAHIPTIDYDYDRLNAGGSSDYSVSFDPVRAGDLQGRGLVRGIRGARVHGATVIELGGPQTDPTTPLLVQGARNVLQPRYDTGAYRLVASQSVEDNHRAGAVFEHLLTAGGGHVDGVLAAGDGVADAVIAVLRRKGLNGKVRVTGLGATPEALKAILRGDQFMTVFPSVDQQTTETAKLAGALARSDYAAAGRMVSMTLSGSTTHHKIRAILIPPVFITVNTVKQVIDSRLIDSHDVCDSELALRCDQLGISR
ncbi:MAG: substrate-binding domain-containing protein [Pseudonocardiales bacterium]|nr:substrate-binding domain-containing protein [Pseudonocardiales bacterium]